jgi:hypothetical protein
MRTLTRSQAIEEIRQCLLDKVGDHESMCQVAARCDLLCHGFSQWTFDELRERYDWIVERQPDMSREDLERLANVWQLARQEVHGTELSCDTQILERDTCRGWDDFSDAQIVECLGELSGEAVELCEKPGRPSP